MIFDIVQIILLVFIGSHLLWTVFMHLCTWYYFARRTRRDAAPRYAPSVSIIKPTKGVDQAALENFRSFCEQEYEGEYELLFCVEDPSDSAVPVIRQIITEYPDKRVRLIFSDPQDTRSFGKLKNMIAGVAASAYEIIIFSDSDAHVSSSFLRETVACTQDPVVGLGFGAPAYVGTEDWAAVLTSISVNELVLRVTTLSLFGLFNGAIGTAMVVRRKVIEEIGGLEQLGWPITDDIPLAQTLRRRGYRIHLLQQPARIIHRHDRFRDWWSHMRRWLMIIRCYLPVPFVLMNLVDLALWWSLLYLIIALFQGENTTLAVALIVVVLGTSLISIAVINMMFVCNRQLWRFLWVVLIRELLRLPLVVHSCLTHEVVWRGRRFHVDSNGTTRIVESRAAAHDSA